MARSNRRPRTPASGLAVPTPGQIKVHQIKQRAAPLLDAGEFRMAISMLEEVLPLDRRDPALHKMLGLGYASIQRADKARLHLQRAMSLGIRDADTVLGLAGILVELGDLKAAMRLAEDVLAVDPNQPRAIRFKAWVLRSMDMADEANGLLDNAITAGVWSPEISMMRSEILRRLKRHEESVAESKRLLDEPGLPADARRDGMFTLGLTYDAMGEHDLAFAMIERANAMLEDKEVMSFEKFREAWSKESIDQIPVSSETSDKPVFVIGMPRSGTTLTEQILTAHPRVATVGESNAMPTLAGGRFAAHITGEYVDRLPAEYLERMGASRFPKAARIVDKMPANYYFLPMIRRALPGASIVHCTRDARDTCLSCFFQNFGLLQPTSRRITTIARQYVLYRQIMDHWAEVLDADILENNYEALTSDPKPHVERMLKHVGVPWHDACMAHHKQKSNVRTASVDQVRNPIYTSSQQRWKRYEKHLGPMLEILEGY